MPLPRAAVFAFFLLASCRTNPQTPASIAPATYLGEIPCADCPGIQLTVTLFPDNTYRLRQYYLERPGTFYELGRWSRDNGRLTLASGQTPRLFRVLDDGRIRMLDAQGNDIASQLNYDLARQAMIDPIPGPMPLRGTYTYMADAASLAECSTGKTFPVSIEAANIELERAYPGQPTFAVIEGRFGDRAPDPSAPPREHIIPTGLLRFAPGETCAGAPQAERSATAMSLVGPTWILTEIDGQQPSLSPGQRAPMIAIEAATNRVRGNGGCNQLTGSVAQTGTNGVSFKNVASTRMACPALDLESKFFDVLNATASYRISGEMLELLDGSGTIRARFRSE